MVMNGVMIGVRVEYDKFIIKMNRWLVNCKKGGKNLIWNLLLYFRIVGWGLWIGDYR